MKSIIVILLVLATACTSKQVEKVEKSHNDTTNQQKIEPEVNQYLEYRTQPLSPKYDSVYKAYLLLMEDSDTNSLYNSKILKEAILKKQSWFPEDWIETHTIPTLDKIINDKGLIDNMFPYSNVDSIVSYQPFDTTATQPSVVLKAGKYFTINPESKLRRIHKLDSVETKMFLQLINNPLSFRTGECGTTFTERCILLYKNQRIVGFIYAGCRKYQLGFKPKNYRGEYHNMVSTAREQFMKLIEPTTANNSYKANASESVNLKQNATNKQ